MMSQSKLYGRAFADAALQFVTYEGGEKFGYVFIQHIERGDPTDFFWRVDNADLDKWGIKKEDLMDCVAQVTEMGHIEDVRYQIGLRPRGGWGHPGIVFKSRKNPKIICHVVFMDKEFSDFPQPKPDVQLYFYYDYFNEGGVSPGEQAFDTIEKLTFGGMNKPGMVGGLG